MTTIHNLSCSNRGNRPSKLRSQLLAGLAVVALALVGLFAAPLTPYAQAVNDQLSKAIEEQRSLIDANSTSPALYSDLGNLLALDQQWGGAEEAYRTALILDPEHGPAAFNLALLLQRAGEDDEALQLLDQVVVSMPEHAWAHYQRGRILASKGERKKAVAAYAAAFAADPELTFPDVNPHLVGNELATEALLRIDESKIPISPDNAPRSYADAQRIVQLLVPVEEVAPDSANAETAEPASPVDDSDSGPRSTEVLSSESLRGGSAGAVEPQREDKASSGSRARPMSVEEAARQNDPRSVNSDDLEDLGRFNQASPQDDDQGPGVTTPRPRPVRTRGVPIIPRDTTPQTDQPTDGQAPGAQPGTPLINRTAPRTPPQPGRFQPGSRSSAQLERRLERTGVAP